MGAILATATVLSVQTAAAAGATPETRAIDDTSKSVTSTGDHKTGTPGQSVRLQARYSVRDAAGAPFRFALARIDVPLAEGLTMTKGSKNVIRAHDGTMGQRNADLNPQKLVVPYTNMSAKDPVEAFDFTVSYSVDIPATAKAGTEYVTTKDGEAYFLWQNSGSGKQKTYKTQFAVDIDRVTVVERAVPLAQPAALGGAAVLALGGYLHVSRRRRQVC
ncbi:hypothetical protein ACFQ7O_01355 [Streptomyces sp. NPDC056485]|uniref:hypothetical protein n=1 Tax=Streptomyces sp. NPDC056485 TaxID=3345834 RepID=UPI0036B7D2EC